LAKKLRIHRGKLGVIPLPVEAYQGNHVNTRKTIDRVKKRNKGDTQSLQSQPMGKPKGRETKRKKESKRGLVKRGGKVRRICPRVVLAGEKKTVGRTPDTETKTLGGVGF